MHPFLSAYGTYLNTPTETFEMSDDAKRVRRHLEDSFIQTGRCGNVAELARELDLDQERLWRALYLLERGVQVMFVPGTEDIIKLPPFSHVPTRHRVTVDGESKWYAGCAGESCALDGMFPGRHVTIDSHCPDCWEPIRMQSRDRQLISIEPATAVVHIGIHPDRFSENWVVTCDSLNFFRSTECIARWEKELPERRGVAMPAEQAFGWVEHVAKNRYWNYDRGPDCSPGSTLIETLESMGLDTSVWKQG